MACKHRRRQSWCASCRSGLKQDGWSVSQTKRTQIRREGQIESPVVCQPQPKGLSGLELIPGFIIKSRVMQDLANKIKLIAARNVVVLIQGESGVGKELVARMIHQLSPRVDKPFLYLNCAGMPETLIESELFGHARGAFTDAHVTRSGLFRVAEGGTLFLDEISELPLISQPKILGVLQNGEIRSVGGDINQKVDVRIISASNQDLEALVKERKFRADLFYRLNVILLKVPPLRERREEIPILAEHFLTLQNNKYPNLPQKKFSIAALDFLEAQSWPGNVRQLENIVTRLAILTSGMEIGEEEIWNVFPVITVKSEDSSGAVGKNLTIASRTLVPIGVMISSSRSMTPEMKEAYRRDLMGQLIAHGWNVSKTAKALNMKRVTLYSRSKMAGIDIKAEKLKRFGAFGLIQETGG